VAAIGALVGALTGWAEACGTTNYILIAKTPEDARTLVTLVRLHPPLMWESVIGSVKDVAKGCFNDVNFDKFYDPATRSSLAALKPEAICATDGDAFTDVSIIWRSLQLLAGEVSGVHFPGPVVFPSSYSRRTSNKGFNYGNQPPPDSATVSLPGVLDYIGTCKGKDSDCGPQGWGAYTCDPLTKEQAKDPLMWPTGAAAVYKDWATGRATIPEIKDAHTASVVLSVLRTQLPAIAKGVTTYGGTKVELNDPRIRRAIKSVRVLAGEDGPDPVLSPLVGDVTINQPASAPVEAGHPANPPEGDTRVAPPPDMTPWWLAAAATATGLLGLAAWFAYKHEHPDTTTEAEK
jgi:hypothetical protein